jgi:hypothetical protein
MRSSPITRRQHVPIVIDDLRDAAHRPSDRALRRDVGEVGVSATLQPAVSVGP